MGYFFTYALQSAVFLCLGYLTYKWVMAGERQHTLNRTLLYAIYILALLLPALNGKWENLMPSHPAEIMPSHPGAIFPMVEPEEFETGIVVADQPPFSVFSIILMVLMAIYFIGMAFTFIITVAGAIKIARIIHAGEKIKDGRFTLVISERDDIAPFSCLNYYVMSRKDYGESAHLIALHENRHLQLHHWIDLLIVQAVTIFQWFNPAAWLIGEEFRAVHEYQADEAVMRSDVNITEYQNLLIRKAVGTRFQSLANSLNHSKLKKRVTMMYKTKSSKKRRMSALLIIPALGIGCALVETPAIAAVLHETSDLSFEIPQLENKVNQFTSTDEIAAEETAQTGAEIENTIPSAPETTETGAQNPSLAETPMETEMPALEHPEEATTASSLDAVMQPAEAPQTDEKEKVYVAVDTPAEFPGGMTALMKFLYDNIRYPENAYKNDIQGRVIVRFDIQKDGSVTNFKVFKSVDPELDQEAIRVLQTMPKWTPGKVNGEPVASQFNLPVTFKITKDDKTTSEETKKTE